MSMDQRKDAGHRPWADHKGEAPSLKIDIGPEPIEVTLDAWGPKENLFVTIYRQIESNWGDEPVPPMKDSDLTEKQWELIDNAIKGGTIQNPFEAVTFMFTINGISRACTHQIVRTRLGASFMQHGGRDNDWRHRNWSMPEAIYRACCEWNDQKQEGVVSPVLDWKPIEEYIEEHFLEATECSPEDMRERVSLFTAISNYILQGRKLYAALVDAGVAFQDARHVLHIGTETYIHANYNFLALRGLLANRLEHINDWEINCVVQLMLRQIRMQCPALLWKYLKSHSDKLGRAAFAGLDSWPPDQKYPAPWKQADRKFRPEQNPFFVLTEEAMQGGRVEWIRTNGIYPGRERNEIVETGDDSYPVNQ